ncbi:MAG: hypothetical protein WDN23_19505 [Edaphobacter sp.]
MSRREQLNRYIAQVQQQLRLDAGVRGAAVVAAVALVATVLLTLILNHYAFPEHAVTPARLALLAILCAAVGFGLALPLLRLDRSRSIRQAEATFPELDQRLVTFSEREREGDPFIELLAADTLAVADGAPAVRLVPQRRLLVLMGAGIACVGVLTWMVFAGPGYLGYGASILWTGPKANAAPLYEIRVTPGDAAVRRNSDELVTAEVVGLDTNKVNLYARYQSSSKWEPVAMQRQEGAKGFQFLFAGLPESVEYYVEAGPVQSKHFKFRVVDLPTVKQIQVTYHYPKWTGLQQVSEEHSGDLRALEGTDAALTVVMDAPLKDGELVMDNGQPLHLTGGEGNRYQATVHMEKDGAYHVAAMDSGQQVRLSEDYFISTSKANPPEIAIDRPGQDYRASPIEEVTIGVRGGAEFGLRQMELHYSVNGGPDKTVDLLKGAGEKSAKGTTTLSLEDFKLVPGDVVSLYATAKDAHAESRTEIGFIQAEPFEREFSQSQQMGGGGGGGGGQNAGNQTDISRREKELIAATWKQQNDKTATAQQAADMGKVLSEAQAKLREQALALSGRMQSRDLADANEEFNSFEKDMQAAATAMVPSAEKLKQQAWHDAMPNEQKALQALLRAEATFRQIQVAFGQRGGGGGGGGSAGRDLASLFDLELDTEKNQYETAQTGSPAEEQAKKVDEALQKLDALAKRQEELSQQQQNKAQNFQQRWQQEMLRREAEQLQHDMEQMQGQQGQQGQQGGQQTASGASGQSSSGQGASGQSSLGQGKQSQSQQARAGSPATPDSKDGAADPRVQQALERLRAANEAMRRAGDQRQGGPQSSEEAQRAAQRLREATNLLGGAQKQQESGKLDSLSREAGRLTKEERAQADRIHSLASQQPDQDGEPSPAQMALRVQELRKLADDRQQLSDDLSHLQKGLRDTAREMAPNQPGTSSKLRDALGEMDQSDLGNRVQRTADWLRRGINPNSNGTEDQIASDLKKLNDEVRQAQQGLGSERDSQGSKAGQGTETAALDHVERLRNEIQGLSSGRGQNGQRPGTQQGQPGQRGQTSGQPGQQGQAGQNGQQGQQGQAGQSAQAQSARGGGQQGGGQQGNRTGGRQFGQAGSQGGEQQDGQSGDIGDGIRRGGGGAVTFNVNTGNNQFDRSQRAAAPDNADAPPDSERTIQQGLRELNQLRQLAKNDPAALREIQDLVKEMQQLDPSRFPGNPAMVEQLHTQVLNDVDKLELQIRRNADDPQAGQVRTSKAPTVPAGYQDAVAEYYRRLGKGQ